MKLGLVLATLFTAVAAAGCGTIASIGTGAGAMPLNELPEYDGPRQVIYRIDEHRYITTERYRRCDGMGHIYWHDDNQNLHVDISWTGMWHGRYAIAPGLERIAFPTFSCEDKGCYLRIKFSNDGGKTWDTFSSERFNGSPWENRDRSARTKIEATDVRVTADGLIYVIPWHRHHYYRYRLDGTPDQRPEGTGPEDRANRVYDWEDLSSVPDVKTPSGQERFTCDSSLDPPPRPDDE